MAAVDEGISENGIIREGNQIVLQREKVLKVFQARKQRTVWFERTKFTLDAVIGQPWGSVFDATSGKLEKIEQQTGSEELDKDEAEMEEGRDNRNLVDHHGNQKLTREDIHGMKNKGASGQDIVENLIENSSTFSKKTEFAQQKYIKKKKKKHTTVFTVLKPNTRLLTKMYYSRGPSKICNLRIDSIGQLLTYANIHAGSRVMVAEGCIGLVLGAVMDRIQGSRDIVQFYTGTAPVRSALENFDFPKDYYNGLHSYPINRLCELQKKEFGESASNNSSDSVTDAQNGDNKNVVTENQSDTKKLKIDNEKQDTNTATATVSDTVPMDTEESSTKVETTENPERDGMESESSNSKDCETESKESEKEDEKSLKRKKEEEERDERRQAKQAAHARTQTLLLEKNMDALVVALRCHPSPIVTHLIRYLAPSRPFVVFSPYKEPLLDCYMKLRDHGLVINLRLTETWLRNYQVLSNRTHPEINMSGTGGYLLTGTTVKDP